MTNNIDRAARALYDHRLTVGDFPDGVTEWKDLPDPWKDEWREAADALADAGLLAPDLPESDDGEWEDGHSIISLDDEGFVLLSIDSRPTHPGRARRIAYKILAAADHAEGASHAQDD